MAGSEPMGMGGSDGRFHDVAVSQAGRQRRSSGSAW